MRGLLCSLYRSRRRSDRRREIQWRGHYVDSHELSLLIMALGVTLLCIADAYFTVVLLQFGAKEVNPLMDWLLKIDHQLFFVVKFALTGICLVWLVMHQKFRVFGVLRVYHMLAASLLLYAGLVYHQVDLLKGLPVVLGHS